MGPAASFWTLWDMYQLVMGQFVSQVVAGPFSLMILGLSSLPIRSSVVSYWLRKSGTRRLFLDTLGHVPTGYGTIVSQVVACPLILKIL